MSARITLHLMGSASAREDSCWLHTHAYACTIPPEISFWPDTQASSALFKLCLFLSLSAFLTCLLPLARLPDFTLSVLLAVLCLSPYILFCFSQTLPPSVSLFSSPPPLSLSLSLSTGVVLVELCISLCCVSALKATSLMEFLVCPHSYVPSSASAPFSTSLNCLVPQATQAKTTKH